MIIYRALNKITNKSYIGQTINSLEFRKKQHIAVSKKIYRTAYFTNSIRKYKKENFVWKILCECNSKEELDEMEFHYIKQYNSIVPYGYNLTYGGEGTIGFSPTKRTREKLRQVNLGKILSEEHKRKISKSQKGKKLSEETKRKISESHKGKNHPLYGKNHSEETKKKMSKWHKGKLISKETRNKISKSLKEKKITAWNKGKSPSKETKRKMSESHKGQTSWNKGKILSEEHKKKISKSMKRKIEAKKDGVKNWLI